MLTRSSNETGSAADTETDRSPPSAGAPSVKRAGTPGSAAEGVGMPGMSTAAPPCETLSAKPAPSAAPLRTAM